MSKRTWKEVITFRPYRHASTPRYAVGSNILVLECGHEIRRKDSQGVPKRAHCFRCHQAAQP